MAALAPVQPHEMFGDAMFHLRPPSSSGDLLLTVFCFYLQCYACEGAPHSVPPTIVVAVIQRLAAIKSQHD